MLVTLGSVALFIIPARMLSEKFNKGPAYAIGLLTSSIVLLGGFFILPARPTPLIYLLAFLLGMALSTQWVFPFSMLPDVIEHDELVTGERREGMYYGLNFLLRKIGLSLGVALPGWVLAWVGYVPNVAQTSQSLFGIRILFMGAPALAFLICVPILFRYPITRKSYAALVQQLKEKKAKGENA
jgi:GPH family glycoside/pentoside/hexuronide:cation symporter